MIMQNVTKLFNGLPDARYLGPAEVAAEVDRHGEVGITITSLCGDAVIMAQSAVPYTLSAGDHVLVIQEADKSLYIIGLLNRSIRRQPEADRLQLPDGSYAIADASTDGPKLKIYSNQDKLLVEYDAAAEKVTVSAQAADLKVSSELGSIDLEAAHAIRLEADRVDIVGRSEIGLRLGKAYERLKSSLTFLPGVMELSAQKFNLAAKRGEIDIEALAGRSDKAVMHIGRLKTLADKIDVAARSIVERTKYSYRWSQKLNQWYSGRMRMIARDTFHLKSKNAILTSDEDVKINAEKIHLG